MIEYVEISNIMDNIFDLIIKIDKNKNISEEELKILSEYKQKYSINLYTSSISNYYKIKINSFGENVEYNVFLDQIINFIENIKLKLDLFLRDINLENIFIEIISTKIYEKIINTNIKNLTELKNSKFSQKIILINKIFQIKIELEKNLPNIELDYDNLLKPLDNSLFIELKEKIKIMENNLYNSWLNPNFFLMIITFLNHIMF